MQLEHSFSVPVGVEEAWRILNDIDRIGPCLPGTKIDSVDGDEITGAVKVKLGPLNLNYRGTAQFLERDEAARRAVVDANGSDVRGHGTAVAKVIATLHADGDAATTVQVVTDLDLTGKPAQFGHGVMVDVGNKLLGQFAAALAKTLPASEAASEAATEPPAHAAVAADPVPAPEPPAVEAAAPPIQAEPWSESAVLEPPTSEPAAEQLADDEVDELAETAAESGALAADDLAVADIAAPDEAGPAGLDVLHFARPAMAKRLAPIAVALVIVLIAVRRRSASRR